MVNILRQHNLIRILLLTVLLLLLIIIIGFAKIRETSKPGLDNFGPIPEFTLLDAKGRLWNPSDFGDSIVVLSFLYTKCLDTCPLLINRLSFLHKELTSKGLFRENLLFASIVLDPELLDPEEMINYQRSVNMNGDNWILLTGTREQLKSLVTDGFKLAFSIEPSIHMHSDGSLHRHADGPLAIAHSNRFILIDSSRNIRRYYDGLTLNLDDLITDINTVRRD